MIGDWRFDYGGLSATDQKIATAGSNYNWDSRESSKFHNRFRWIVDHQSLDFSRLAMLEKYTSTRESDNLVLESIQSRHYTSHI